LFPRFWYYNITPAKLIYGGLLTYSSVSQILNLVSERASDPSLACNTQEKTVGGRWGILNKIQEEEGSILAIAHCFASVLSKLGVMYLSRGLRTFAYLSWTMRTQSCGGERVPLQSNKWCPSSVFIVVGGVLAKDRLCFCRYFFCGRERTSACVLATTGLYA
jgi:hypothetical protein